MADMAMVKPIGKSGRKRKISKARGVTVSVELRLRDYARFRKLAYSQDLSMAALARELILAHLSTSK